MSSRTGEADRGVEPHAAEAACVRRSVAIVRPWSYTSWVAFTVFCESLATGNRRHDGAPVAGSTQLLVELPRLASPPAAQPLVVPPWCATGRRGSSEAAALHAPAGGGAAFSRSLCSGFPAFIGGRRCCRFQSSCRAAAPVGALSGRRRPGEAGGGSLHLVHTLHSVAYLYTSIFPYYRKSYGRVIVFIDTFKDE